jgi:hypothetical protein
MKVSNELFVYVGTYRWNVIVLFSRRRRGCAALFFAGAGGTIMSNTVLYWHDVSSDRNLSAGRLYLGALMRALDGDVDPVFPVLVLIETLWFWYLSPGPNLAKCRL